VSDIDDDSIQSILSELKTLNDSLSHDHQHYEDFLQFKREYFERNEDMRDNLREITGDMRTQSRDIDNLKTNVSELKIEFKSLKFELAPLLELKKYIQEQVIRYSSVGFVFLLTATLGMGQIGL